MVRCPHCSLILSASEAKSASCPVCKGVINDSAASAEVPAARPSVAEASGEADQAPSDSTVASASTSTRTALAAPRGVTWLVGPVALWLLMAAIWLTGGSAIAIPPRLLGLLLLGVPVVVAIFAYQAPKADDE